MRIIWVVLGLVLFTACGGGGATDAASEPPTTTTVFFDGLSLELTFRAGEVESGTELHSTLRIENRSGHDIMVPDCNVAGARYALVPVDEPDAELWLQPVIDCGGPFVYEDGYGEEFDGPTFPAATKFGEPLPPGEYFAVLEAVGIAPRVEYPITIEPAD